MQILYLDCFSGIAGDMFLGAMVDAGLPFEKLKKELKKLNLRGYELRKRKVNKNGVAAAKIDVMLGNNGRSHRSYKDIQKFIQKSALPENVKTLALGIFGILAQAEAKVHKKELSEVTFHEVGGVDSIVDIVGAAIAIQEMKIKKVYCSPLNIGSGWGKFHGHRFRIPAPATREILRDIPTYAHGKGEMVTPTGASLAKCLCERFEKPQMRILMEGFGAGDAEFAQPNVLRVLIGEIQWKRTGFR